MREAVWDEVGCPRSILDEVEAAEGFTGWRLCWMKWGRLRSILDEVGAPEGVMRRRGHGLRRGRLRRRRVQGVAHGGLP